MISLESEFKMTMIDDRRRRERQVPEGSTLKSNPGEVLGHKQMECGTRKCQDLSIAGDARDSGTRRARIRCGIGDGTVAPRVMKHFFR
jgi:hypothetical protein